jgi:hypothetical protein
MSKFAVCIRINSFTSLGGPEDRVPYVCCFELPLGDDSQSSPEHKRESLPLCHSS